MASFPTSSDEWLALRPVRVMCDALDQGRLSHSLILSGEEFSLVEATGHFVAKKILERQASPAASDLDNHPDFHTLRPTGKMRQISADNTRELIRKIHHSPQAGERKAALVYEADRMHPSAANIFLKTLEEPPGNTTIVLLTSRPSFLLPTIRSRCLHFRLPRAETLQAQPEAAEQWLGRYGEWLATLPETNLSDKKAIADRVLGLYGLLAQFSGVLKTLTNEAWQAQKEQQSAHLTEEEIAAIEEGIKKGIRDRIFAAIERRTRDFACGLLKDKALPPERPVGAFAAAIAELERCGYLLRVNLNEATALEGFLLTSLRLWTRVRQG